MSKYRYRLTGLTVDLAKTDSPIVQVDFCLATKDEDESGLPEFVEGLIFYPHEEALHLLATHCLGKEIISWSRADHTCFSVSTAGTSGLLEILPILLDHILFPYIRTDDYLTDAHFKNENGDDAMVYINDIWFTDLWQMMAALFKLLFPGESGYHNAGVLIYLRNSNTIQKIRDYHKKFYRAENLNLIISGKIDQHQIFKRLASIERKIFGRIENQTEFKRPWGKPLQSIGNKGNHIKHEFPSEDETKGKVYFGFRFTNHITEETLFVQAIWHLLLDYMKYSKVFSEAFLEKETLCALVLDK